MKRRINSGAALAEFPAGLSLFFAVFLPVCFSAVLLLLNVTLAYCFQKQAERIACSESRLKALELSRSISECLPKFLAGQLNTPGASGQLKIVICRGSCGRIEFPAERPLPATLRPLSRGNERNLYLYRLYVRQEIKPLINLKGLPISGELPLISAPAVICFQAELPLEYPQSLEI
ncbi:MAG: hypothetical protein K2X27_10950 [Candidatus Obscuribacterales bacterium]|nr:hypothetical protein [Candidatus Obscuribacterales bacterium]